MRPLAPAGLGVVIAELAAQAAAVSDDEVAFALLYMSRGLVALANEYDVCASRRVEEIRALCALLARGAALSSGRYSWDDLDADATDDLRISVLEARLDELRQRMIGFQAWLEEQDGTEEAALLRDVLVVEYEFVTRRARDRFG